MIDKTWLATCATAGEFLYGEYSVSVLKKLYERKYTSTPSNLIAAMKELRQSGTILMDYCEGRLDEGDDDFGFFVPTHCEGTPLEKVMKQADADGNPYASLHFDKDEQLNLAADTPEGLEYYIPTEQEIAELVSEGYISTPAMTKLEDAIRKRGGDTEFLKGLWPQISTDKLDKMEAINAVVNGIFPQPDEVKNKAEGEQLSPELMKFVPTIDDLNSVLPFVNDFLNNVNLRARKGWRSNDLFKKQYPNGMKTMPTLMPGSALAAKHMKGAEAQLRAMGAKVDYSSIDNFTTIGPFGERRVVKVGRNDLCPCGSGKKYKRCHGRG